MKSGAAWLPGPYTSYLTGNRPIRMICWHIGMKDASTSPERVGGGGRGLYARRKTTASWAGRATILTRGAHVGARHRRGAASGQAIVEFALVITPVLMMIFGIVEFSLITSSIGGFNFAAKDSARLGSLLGRTDDTVDQQMVALVRNRVVGLVAAKTLSIEIFRSDSTGAFSTTEDEYDVNGNVSGPQTWPPDVRNDDLINADYLGVRITFRYTYLTAFISSGAPNLTLTATSVQRIEPQDFQSRRQRPPTAVASLVTTAGVPSLPQFWWPWQGANLGLLSAFSWAKFQTLKERQ